MMKNEKMIKKYRYVAFAIVPVVVFLFVGISCVNGQENADYEKKAVASVSATKMNVLYLGVDNPIKVAVSGYKSSEISVEITNGRIRGGDGEYIINPKKPGNSLVSVKVGEETVEVIPFRVKPLPYPRVEVGGMSGGEIRKSVLLAKEGVVTMMPNFDFDLRFVVQSFTVSTTDEDGYYVEVSSDSNKFTREQKQLIEKSRVGSRVNIEKVKAVGPDGSIRLLQAIVFEIVE